MNPPENTPSISEEADASAEPRIDPNSAHVDKVTRASESLETLHREKVSDPRVGVTRFGIYCGIAVSVLAVLMTIGTVVLRRTQTERTAAFWGDESIRAFQLASRVELVGVDGDPQYAQPVDITAMPGLGHLRNALLDQRHYQWDSAKQDVGISERQSTAVNSDDSDDDGRGLPDTVRVIFSDPEIERFQPTDLTIGLSDGIVGVTGGRRSVKFTDHVRPKIRHHLTTILNYERLRENESDE